MVLAQHGHAGADGLKGRLWVDQRTHYMTRMEGHIFQAVSVGLVLAKLYPGGELTFEQAEVVPGRYLFTSFVEHLNVRAMLVKTIRENMDIEGSNHQAVPPVPYQQAIQTLLASPLPR